MLYADVVARWRLRAGLADVRDDCAVDFTAGINYDNVLKSRIADWYVRLVREGHTDVIVATDISGQLSLRPQADAHEVLIDLPASVLRPASLWIGNKPCTIIDAASQPRRAALALACTPRTDGPADDLAAVYYATTHTLILRLRVRPVMSDISCTAYCMPPTDPAPDTLYPVTPAAMALLPDRIIL